MATAPADAWQRSDLRAERPPLPRSDRRPPPPLPPLPPLPGGALPVRGATTGPRDRSAVGGRPANRAVASRARAERLREDLDRVRPPVPRDPALPSRPVGRAPARSQRDDVRAARATRTVQPLPPKPAAAEPAGGSRLRGTVAVLGVFLVTLAGAATDSFVGRGLGLITLVALATTTSIAVLLVRRRDMISVVLAPPLVFVAVAGLNIALAPTVSLSLPTAATLMIRGFPTMAAATAAAVVLCLIRLTTRR